MYEDDLGYTVTSYSFTGFFPPINNLPALNNANAGSSVPDQVQPLRFPRPQPVCPGLSGLADDELRRVRSPARFEPITSDGFTYDPLLDQYKNVWKTQKSWRGTCRQLIVRFRDGTEKRANFRFQ